MTKRLSTIIFSLTAALPSTVLPLTSLTSCNSVWGHQTPIHFGSSISSNKSNPFYKFLNDSDINTLKDGNGNTILNYLQHDYTLDLNGNKPYAYSSPVTKWLYAKDSDEAKKAESQYMPIDKWGSKWESNNDAWYAADSSIYNDNNKTFSGTLKNDKYKTYTNSKNVTESSNITFTSAIATTISQYLTGALKYQASQINKTNDDNLNIAWGNGANFLTKNYTLNHGVKGSDIDKDKDNDVFYEYIFAQSNSHVVSKANRGAFLRTTCVDFNYDTFPIPSYTFTDANYQDKDISSATKKLLLGSNATADTKFCQAGTNSSIPCFYTSKTDGTINTTLGVDSSSKAVTSKLSYTDYIFENVPIFVTVNGFTQRWVDPTKNNSIQVKDFYINDKDTVTRNVGTFTNIKEYATATNCTSPTIKEYTFRTDKSESTKIQVSVKPTNNNLDTRIVSDSTKTFDGNKFLVLVNYAVREYNNDKFFYKSGTSGDYTDYFNNLLVDMKKVDSSFDENKLKTYLMSKNSASISKTSLIFPAFILNIYNDLFKKAYTPSSSETSITNLGYILDSDKVINHTSALLGIYNRTTTEGYKGYAKDLTQDSKNLLTFLTYMFGYISDDNKIDFVNKILTKESF